MLLGLSKRTAAGLLALVVVLSAGWLWATTTGTSNTGASPVKVPGAEIDLPPSLAEQVQVGTLEYLGEEGGRSHFTAVGTRAGTVCLISADSRDFQVAAVACDFPEVAARKGIYIVRTDEAGVGRGALLLPAPTASARVNGAAVAPLGSRVVPFSAAPAREPVVIETQGPRGEFTVPSPRIGD